jgi:hypothetical protein
MKKTIFILFAIIIGFSFNTKAHDFSVVNSDGDTIYYNITSSIQPYKVAVTYKGSSYSSYLDEYIGDITIPDSVLFNNIYYKVTVISQSAFSSCTGLTSINIPTYVTNIGSVAFQNCTSLDTLYFNATNSISIGNITSPVFQGCINLNTIIIGNNVTRIPYYAFIGCTGLTSINIPSSVTSIGLSAFQNCTNLININLPSTITSLPGSVFSKCTSLKSINIPSSITSIADHAFSECKSLDSVIIPSSVTSLGTFIFSYCDSLTYVSIPNSINSLPNNAFQNCISLTTLNAPSITTLGNGVFIGCKNLISYSLPNNITNIPINTFQDCSSLTSINIPTTVTNIKASSFKGCTSLSSINLPISITFIENNAFDSCTSLSKINFPSLLGFIRENAFRNCSSLDTIITNRKNPPSITSTTFKNIPNNIPIILSCNSQLNYQTANYWSSFTNFHELETCLYTINVQSIDPTIGTVTGSGIYPFDTITITATPLQNYSFVRWQDGDTNSIRTVIVTKDSNFTAIFKQVIYSNINDTICQGQTYPFFGNNLITEGLYSHTIVVSITKDSIINLQLKVNPTYSIDIYDTICNGQTYTQNGFNADSTGLFILNLQTSKGCDSIINLHLLVNQSPTTNIQASICQGHTYSLNGFNADTAGTHTLNLQTYKGCDSTVNLSLLINPTYTIDIQGEVCEGRFYYQNGFFVHMPGTYTRFLQTTKGCDSIVNLHLTVNPTFSDTIFAQICQGEVYTEYGFNANTTGFYTQNLQSIKGCDSIIYLSLIVNEITTPTNLSLNNIANFIELNWEGEEENYIIYRNNDSLAMTTSRIYKDSNVVEGVNYCYKIKAINGYCESEFCQPVCKTFLDLNTITTNDFNVILYPNPTTNKTRLEIKGLKSNADVIVYDIYGRTIKTYKLNANQNELEIDVKEFAKGVYNIKLTNSDCNITKKLIVK